MIVLAREEKGRRVANDNTMRWDAEEVRRSQRSPQQQRKHPRKQKKRGSGVGYYVGILVVSAILAGIGWLMCNDILALQKEPHSASIVVTEDQSIGSIADSLKEEGLIEYKTLFLLYNALSDTEIAAGAYELNTNMDYHALISAMSARSGVRKIVKVTIPEGYSMQETFELLEKNNVNSVKQLTEAAANGDYDYEFLEGKEKGSASRLEGYLFPDTYEFYCGGSPETVINKFLRNFDHKLTDDLKAAVEKSPFSLDEILTIASLIEKETDGNDQGKISSVIRNRLLKKGETAGYLQIDAALLYGLGEHKEKITDADKEVDTPYNLYLHKGLPPTPITNPGITSIRAALYPDNTNYYYYALGKDNVHHFFTNYREFVNFLNSLKG